MKGLKAFTFAVLMLFTAMPSVFSSSISEAADEKRYDVPLEGSPSTGPLNAPVLIIEFLDYQ